MSTNTVKTCPKCGEGLRIGYNHDFSCGSFIDTKDGKFYESHTGSCLRRQRDALENRVRELVEAGDLMCKYYLVYGPESVMAKEAWTKAKGQQ